MKLKKQIREKFRHSVFHRDGYQCVFCSERHTLDAHHITDRNEMPNGGYTEYNGITLCAHHHQLAEQYHISKGERWAAGFHPNDLYKKIGSSYDLAYAKSEEITGYM